MRTFIVFLCLAFAPVACGVPTLPQDPDGACRESADCDDGDRCLSWVRTEAGTLWIGRCISQGELGETCYPGPDACVDGLRCDPHARQCLDPPVS